MSFLPRIFTPDDVRAVQRSLKAGVEETNIAIDACSALDDATKAQWAFFKNSALTYVAVPVTGIGPAVFQDILTPLGGLIQPAGVFGNSTELFFQTGRGYEAQLVEFQTKIKAAGCKVTDYHPASDDQETGAEKALKWVAVIAIAAAGAYAVSQIVPAVVAGVEELKLAHAARKRLSAGSTSGAAGGSR